MSNRLLLTGVGGSVGCHTLVHILHNTDWEVVGLDSFRHRGLTDRVAKMLSYHPEYKERVTILTHDLTAPISEMLERRIGPIDHLIQMASLSDVHDSIQNPVPFVLHNVQLILNVLEYAKRAKPSTFLQISTDEVYGPTDGVKTHKEWSSILPSNPYSASKAAQEAVAISYWRSYNIPLIVVNLMNNFGEMQSPHKFPAIVQRKVRRGEIVGIHSNKGVIGSRCYIHSRNSSDAVLFILKNVPPRLHTDGSQDRPKRFNIVGDKQLSNLELAQMIADTIGKPLEWEEVPTSLSRPGHDIHYGLDGAKLESLGWKSPVSVEESMRNTVRWYEENPEWLEAR